MDRVFSVLKTSRLAGIPLMLAFAVGPWATINANAQSTNETDALSVGVRSALAKTGGGRVLSAERIPNGPIGMSRVKIVDPGGRVQVLIIEDATRSQRRSPFEREESRFYRGRLLRGDGVPPPSGRDGSRGPKLRSGDVQD